MKVSQANSRPFKKTLGQNVLAKPTAASKAEDEDWLGMYPQSTPGNCDRCVQSNADPLHCLPWFPSPSSSAGFTLSIEKNLAETSAIKEQLHSLLAGLFYLILAPYIFLPPGRPDSPTLKSVCKVTPRREALVSLRRSERSHTWAFAVGTSKAKQSSHRGRKVNRNYDFSGSGLLWRPKRVWSSLWYRLPDRTTWRALSGKCFVLSFSLTPPSNQHSLETMLTKCGASTDLLFRAEFPIHLTK